MSDENVKVERNYQRKSLPCPRCQCIVSNVIDSRPSTKHIRRRRKCEKCGQRFSTFELYADEYAKIEELREFRERFRSLLAV